VLSPTREIIACCSKQKWLGDRGPQRQGGTDDQQARKEVAPPIKLRNVAKTLREWSRGVTANAAPREAFQNRHLYPGRL